MLRRILRHRPGLRRRDTSQTFAFDAPAETPPQPPAAQQPAAAERAAPDPDAAQHLENLRAALQAECPDLYVRLRRGGAPRLTVANPHLDGSYETITFWAGLGEYVGGHYVWITEWQLPICPVGDPAAAAVTVLGMLARKAEQQ